MTLRDALHRVSEWERHHRPTLFLPKMAPSASDRVADAISTWAGSMSFVVAHAAWFGGWIAANEGWLAPWVMPFDPYPYGLLTMIVSLEAIFLSTFVMIAQNRLAALSDARAQADYETNVKAEAEVAKLLHLVEALAEHLERRQPPDDGAPPR